MYVFFICFLLSNHAFTSHTTDLTEPVVLSSEREGFSVDKVCKSISKDLHDKFNFALVWGASTRFNPQRVGKDHTLMDEDVLQIVTKTLVQQKRSKDYGEKVDQYNEAIREERRKKHKNHKIKQKGGVPMK